MGVKVRYWKGAWWVFVNTGGRVVMETLGHSQVSLTLNTYSHVLPALQQDAASKMDAILTRFKA